jgi:hypothetical protein
MKKQFLLPVLALGSILLSAFSIAPSPAVKADPSMAVRFITDFKSDGSGELSFEMELSKEMMALLKSAPGFDSGSGCETFFQSTYDQWEMSEKESDGALTCTASAAFTDLDDYKTLVVGEYGNASFTRLEITGGHLYYDLIPGLAGSSLLGEAQNAAGFDVTASWILNMPGEIVDSNASETSGQTLTWDLLKINSTSHIRAESKIGGGALGLDPTLTALAVIGLLGCCCLILLIAAVVLFFVLRKRNNPAPAAAV